MRDILFRAKRLDAGGAWAEGYFVSSGNGTNEIIPKDSYWDFYEGFYPEYEVDPDTLGQYTGLNDMNGRKIFEGDIIEDRTKYKTNDEDTYRRYEVRYSTEWARFFAVLPNGVYNLAAFQNCEVIGNIYDTPDLLGGETE